MAKRRSWDNIALATKKRVERRIRAAAVQVVRDLKEAGPYWSGDFHDSWIVDTPLQFTGFGAEEVPIIKINDVDLRSTLTVYDIRNSSPYAAIAMDLEPGDFIYPGFEPGPLAVEQPRGQRQDGIRGKLVRVKGKNKNRSTAPYDWYRSYVLKGGFAESIANSDRPISGITISL